MGAGSSKEEETPAPAGVVSRFREFMTEHVSDWDRERLDSRAIWKIYRVDKSDEEPDFFFGKADTAHLSGYLRIAIGNSASHHRDIIDAWRYDFLKERVIERVDLRDINDWFGVFVWKFGIRRVDIVIEKSFDSIKLTRTLMMLFCMPDDPLRVVTITGHRYLDFLITESIDKARADMPKMDQGVFVTLMGAYYMPSRNIDKWKLTKDTEGDDVTFTFTYKIGKK
jgi:hypothetical protein